MYLMKIFVEEQKTIDVAGEHDSFSISLARHSLSGLSSKPPMGVTRYLNEDELYLKNW